LYSLLNQLNLAGLGGLLRGQAADFLIELGDAFAQLRLLPDAAGGADVEQFCLAGDHVLHIVIGDLLEQDGRKGDPLGAALLGLQPRRPRPQPVEVLGDDGQTGLGDGVVEPHHDVARLDHVTVAGAQFADHAAGGMLHLLDVGIDHDGAGRDQRAGDLRR
jgi:hypothetical protein